MGSRRAASGRPTVPSSSDVHPSTRPPVHPSTHPPVPPVHRFGPAAFLLDLTDRGDLGGRRAAMKRVPAGLPIFSATASCSRHERGLNVLVPFALKGFGVSSWQEVVHRCIYNMYNIDYITLTYTT